MVEVVDATAHVPTAIQKVGNKSHCSLDLCQCGMAQFFVETDARVWPNTLKTCLRLLVFHDHAS